MSQELPGIRLPTKIGNVRRVAIPDLKMCDGEPTKESLEKLKRALSRRVGIGTKAELACYDDVDEQKVYAYAEKVANDPERKPYS